MTDHPTRQPTSPRRRPRWVLLSLLLLVAVAALATFFSAGVARSMTCDRPAASTPAGDDWPASGLAEGGDEVDCGGDQPPPPPPPPPPAAATSPSPSASTSTAHRPRRRHRRHRLHAAAPSFSTSTRTTRGSAGASLPDKPCTSAMRRTIERPRSASPTAMWRRSTETPLSAAPSTIRSRRSTRGDGRASATTASHRSSSSRRSRTPPTTPESTRRTSCRRDLTEVAASGCAKVGAAVTHRNVYRRLWRFALLTRFCWNGATITALWEQEVAVNIDPIPFPLSLIQGWRYSPVASTKARPGTPRPCYASMGDSTSADSDTGAHDTAAVGADRAHRNGLAFCSTSARTQSFACERVS